jgi:hypothetical protein
MDTRTYLGVMLAATTLVGCAEQEEQVGDVTVALTAPAADGSIYRLTPGTRASIYGGTFYDEYDLDGDGVLNLEVPLGVYQVELVHFDGYTTVWPLQRVELDGTIETVQATLTTVMPTAVTVVADAPAALVFAFQVEDVGTVTFAAGDLDVSIDVDELPADGTTTSMTGDLTASSVVITASAPTGLAPVLPALDQPVFFDMTVRTTGAWAQSAASGACVDVAVNGYSTGPHEGFAALIAESANGSTSAQLCISTFEGTSQASLLLVKSGPASTAAFSAFGDNDYSFLSYAYVDLPGAIFVGDTLHLDELVGVQTVPASLLTRVNARPAGTTGPRARWYTASFTGTMTFQFGATL